MIKLLLIISFFQLSIICVSSRSRNPNQFNSFNSFDTNVDQFGAFGNGQQITNQFGGFDDFNSNNGFKNQFGNFGGGSNGQFNSFGGNRGNNLNQITNNRNNQNKQFGINNQNPQFGGNIQNPQFGGNIQNPQFGGNIQNPQFGGNNQIPQFGGNVQNPEFGVNDENGGDNLNQQITSNIKPSSSQNTGQQNNNNQYGTARSNGLAQHNMYRNKHKAGNLILDDTINNVAQKYAEYLASNKLFQHSNNRNYGENLYQFCSSDLSDLSDSVVKATDSWYNEISLYDFNNPGFSMATGHFTQVVWKSSTKVGFGIGSANGCVTVVANYAPPGNLQGAFPQNVLN